VAALLGFKGLYVTYPGLSLMLQCVISNAQYVLACPMALPHSAAANDPPTHFATDHYCVMRLTIYPYDSN